MFGYISDENLTNSPGDTLLSKKKKNSCGVRLQTPS